MQDRYLGDAHDFVKYALLLHLHHTLRLRIGVNWYLTNPKELGEESNSHGGQRDYLEDINWKQWDQKLVDKLKIFEKLDARSIRRFRESQILPANTLFYEEKLGSATDRIAWHQEARECLSETDVVFLDPDNGFEIQSCTKKSMPKYAAYEEACEYYGEGKIVIGIQFARQCDPIKRGDNIRAELAKRSRCSSRIPILRVRVSPNILFLIMCPDEREREMRIALESFAANSPKFKKNERRIQLIP